MYGFEIIEHGDISCSEVLSQELDKSISEVSSPGGALDETSPEDGPVRDIFRRAEEPRFPYQFSYQDVGLQDLLSGEVHGDGDGAINTASDRTDICRGGIRNELAQRRARLEQLTSLAVS